jgi:hypothetical protein
LRQVVVAERPRGEVGKLMFDNATRFYRLR